MKEIKAYIRPLALEAAIRQLEDAGARDITVIRVDAIGAMADAAEEEHRFIRRYAPKYSAVAKLEIVCRDSDVSRFVEVIRQTAHTGAPGDGRIFVSDISAALNIRRGTTGDNAL